MKISAMLVTANGRRALQPGGARKRLLPALCIAVVAWAACQQKPRSDPSGAMLGDGISAGSGSRNPKNEGGMGGDGGVGGEGGDAGAGGEAGAGGQSSCDDSAGCDICAQCAVLGACLNEQQACDDDVACSQAMLCLEQCNASCVAEPVCYQMCRSTCEMQEAGFLDAVDTLACWCAAECQNDCSAYTTTDCMTFAP